MKIKTINLTATVNENTFISTLTETINNMQNDGLIIEVQYSLSGRCLSALVIGRENET